MFGHRFPSIGKVKSITDEVQARTATNPTKIVTIIGGQDDEVWTKSSVLTTVEADTTNYKIGDRGWKFIIDSAATRGFYIDFSESSAAISLPPASTLCAWFYVPDATKITNLQMEWYCDSTNYRPIILATNTALNINSFQNGWNLLRVPLWSLFVNDTDVNDYFTSLYRLKIYVIASGATEITLAHMWLECPPKAQVLFIQDGGYLSFYNRGYSDLKERGIPCTFAVQAASIGVGANFMSLAQLKEVAAENNNSISMHSSSSVKATNDMTAAELRADCIKCIKFLERNGFTGGLWRAAWLQNLAPQSAACQDLFLAFAMSSGGGGSLSVFPFIKPYDIKRFPLNAYNATPANMDIPFTRIQKTHSLMVCYIHSITDEGDASDISQAAWEYFLNKCTAGMNAGWLECVTMEQLYARAGVHKRHLLGDWVTEGVDELGVANTIRLP